MSLSPISGVRPSTPWTPLAIVHTNDWHEKYDKIPSLVTGHHWLSQAAAATGFDVLRLNAGDSNVGEQASDIAATTRLLNLFGLTAATTGNHEFDLPTEAYARGLAEAQFPTLLSNVRPRPGTPLDAALKSGKFSNDPYIVTMRNGSRYGLIGVTTPDVMTFVRKDRADQMMVDQGDDATARRVAMQVAQLLQAGVNKIVVVSHMGLPADKKLAEAVPGIDVIVGGHSHTTLDEVEAGNNWLTGPTGEPVLIVQTGRDADHIGITQMLFDPQGLIRAADIEMYDHDEFPPDAAAARITTDIMGPRTPVAYLLTGFDPKAEKYADNPLGNFISDAARARTGADIALSSSTQTRAAFSPGEFNSHQLRDLFPFVEPEVVLRLSGQEVWKLLESVGEGSADESLHRPMLYPSGLRVRFDKETGQPLGAIIQNRQTGRWEALDPNKQYTVAITEYFMLNNREFPIIAQPDKLVATPRYSVTDTFLWGLKQAGAPQRPVAFPKDGRVQFVDPH